MKRLLDVIFGRFVMFTVLLFAMAEIVWIGSPLLWFGGKHPFQDRALRWIVIVVIVVFALVVMAWARWRADRGNASVVEALLATAIDDKPSNESADMRAVRKRFEKAIIKLRKVRFGQGGALSGLAARLNGRYLYELPWYLMIGAPGSGKTTALENCGLNFPLATNGAEHAVRGVGGTRNCDWWFTDQAVLIDTAGRFTTQDSDRVNDAATWSGFLGMLKKARPRQPVNGVMVTVSVTDLLTRSRSDRRTHANSMRARLAELHRGLGVRFPIYVLVTKSDLLAGFMDYFDLLDKAQRATPWGTTFPLEDSTSKNVQRFGPEFDALLQRIDDGLIERLQAERDPARRARIYGFANQFAGLRGMLIEFLEAVFEPSEDEPEPLLRGVYFVSGTQEGTPIDRVLGAIARTYRLERAVLAPLHASGKSYFLSRLLGDVVFAESGIAGSNLQWERRRNAFLVGGYALLALATGGALAAWTTLYLDNRHDIERVATQVESVHRLAQGLPDRATADVMTLLPVLSATAALTPATAARPIRFGFGLDQHAKLEGAMQGIHERMLVDAFLPRLELRVATRLREARAANEGRYEALKTYLMLHQPSRRSPAALRTAIETDWTERTGRALDADRRSQLNSQLRALFDLGPLAVAAPEDASLVAFHRAKLIATDLPARLYGRLRERGFGTDPIDFDLAAAVGEHAAPLFARVSNAPITRGVPGFFSVNAYRHDFTAATASMIQQTINDQAWVLDAPDGARSAAEMATRQPALVEAVRRIYLDHYAQTWETYLADLTLASPASVSEARDAALTLGATDGPLPALVKALARETTLIANETVATAASAASMPDGAHNTGESHPESTVDDRFSALRRQLLPNEAGHVPLADTLALIAAFGQALSEAEAARQSGASSVPSSAAARLNSAAANAPAPLRSMLEKLGHGGASVGAR